MFGFSNLTFVQKFLQTNRTKRQPPPLVINMTAFWKNLMSLSTWGFFFWSHWQFLLLKLSIQHMFLFDFPALRSTTVSSFTALSYNMPLRTKSSFYWTNTRRLNGRQPGKLWLRALLVHGTWGFWKSTYMPVARKWVWRFNGVSPKNNLWEICLRKIGIRFYLNRIVWVTPKRSRECLLVLQKQLLL